MNIQELAKEFSPVVARCNTHEVQAIIEKQDTVIIIDVREDHEWQNGHLPYTIHHALSRLVAQDDNGLPSDKSSAIIAYCGMGVRSIVAGKILADMGYTNIKSMDGGITEWRANNFEIVM